MLVLVALRLVLEGIEPLSDGPKPVKTPVLQGLLKDQLAQDVRPS